MDSLDMIGTDDEAAPGRLSRRRLFAGGLAGLGGLSLLSARGAHGQTDALKQMINGLDTGPKRTIVWAIAAIAPWNEPVDVGFNDAVRMLGWEYKKVGVPISEYNAENHVNVIKRAALTKPDVLVTSWWVKGVAGALEDAQKNGIFVMSNDADNYPADRIRLGIAHVGTDGLASGNAIGKRVVETIAKKGRKDGVIVFGNPFPGNENIEVRGRGVMAAVAAYNKANGTKFTVENFGDKADTDAAVSSGLYKAKMTQLGKRLVGIVTVSSVAPTIVVDALDQKGFKPGEIAVGTLRTDPPALKAIRTGWSVGTGDEGYYPLGLVTAILAWQKLQTGFAPASYLPGGSLLDKSNLKELEKREALIHKKSVAYKVRLR